jgi:hypothetical protein
MHFSFPFTKMLESLMHPRFIKYRPIVPERTLFAAREIGVPLASTLSHGLLSSVRIIGGNSGCISISML